MSEQAAALAWYAEDDKRAVEMGLLESVDSRPAHAALEGEPFDVAQDKPKP